MGVSGARVQARRLRAFMRFGGYRRTDNGNMIAKRWDPGSITFVSVVGDPDYAPDGPFTTNIEVADSAFEGEFMPELNIRYDYYGPAEESQ